MNLDMIFWLLVVKVVTLVVLVLTFIADNILIYRDSRVGTKPENKYYEMNREAGFVRSGIVKAVFLCLMLYYFLVDPPVRRVDPFILSWGYIIMVTIFLGYKIFTIPPLKKENVEKIEKFDDTP